MRDTNSLLSPVYPTATPIQSQFPCMTVKEQVTFPGQHFHFTVKKSDWLKALV